MSDRSDTPLRRVLLVSRALADPAPTEQAAAQDCSPYGAGELTGALFFSGGHFVQVLEGPAQALQARLSEIAADPRHGKLTVLLDAEDSRRRFARWHLGRLELDGGNDLLHTLLASAPVAPERAERLLAHLEATAAGAPALSDRA